MNRPAILILAVLGASALPALAQAQDVKPEARVAGDDILSRAEIERRERATTDRLNREALERDARIAAANRAEEERFAREQAEYARAQREYREADARHQADIAASEAAQRAYEADRARYEAEMAAWRRATGRPGG